MRTMIPIATPMLTADWIPSSRCSRARIRSVSSSSSSTCVAASTAPVARASAASSEPGADLVARLLDRPDELGAPDGLGQVADRGHLGREVDVRLDDAVGLAQEPLDPVAARGAGHPDDGERDLDRWPGAGAADDGGRGDAGAHTPPEYNTASDGPVAPGRRSGRPSGYTPAMPRPAASPPAALPGGVRARARGRGRARDAGRAAPRRGDRRGDRRPGAADDRRGVRASPSAPAPGARSFPRADPAASPAARAHLAELEREVAEHLAGTRDAFDVPVVLEGAERLGPPRPRGRPDDPARRHRVVRRGRPADREAGGRAGGRRRGRAQPDRAADPLPSRDRRRRDARRLRRQLVRQPRGAPRPQGAPPGARGRRAAAALAGSRGAHRVGLATGARRDDRPARLPPAAPQRAADAAPRRRVRLVDRRLALPRGDPHPRLPGDRGPVHPRPRRGRARPPLRLPLDPGRHRRRPLRPAPRPPLDRRRPRDPHARDRRDRLRRRADLAGHRPRDRRHLLRHVLRAGDRRLPPDASSRTRSSWARPTAPGRRWTTSPSWSAPRSAGLLIAAGRPRHRVPPQRGELRRHRGRPVGAAARASRPPRRAPRATAAAARRADGARRGARRRAGPLRRSPLRQSRPPAPPRHGPARPRADRWAWPSSTSSGRPWAAASRCSPWSSPRPTSGGGEEATGFLNAGIGLGGFIGALVAGALVLRPSLVPVLVGGSLRVRDRPRRARVTRRRSGSRSRRSRSPPPAASWSR